MATTGDLKVLVCDDQPTVRRLLGLLISTMPCTAIVAEVGDAESAWAVLAREPVDLVLLDLELPGRHGFALLERIMRECPAPVLVISGAAGPAEEVRQRARALGAIGFIAKPDGVTTTHESLRAALAAHVAALQAGAKPPPPGCSRSEARALPVAGGLVAIGSSTGGIVAVIEVLKGLPPGLAPVLITQHMLPGYAEGFARRVANATGHQVQVARGGETLSARSVLVAPSDRHLVVTRKSGSLVAELDNGPKVSGHRPSCDRLFHAVAGAMGAASVGVVLTGMGRDGAEGLKAMRDAGARTLAQDEASSVVFGMPKVAFEMGGAERIVRLAEIGREITALLQGLPAGTTSLRSGAGRTFPQPELQP